MKTKLMQLGMIGTNCYIFWDEDSKKCAVVDPGDDGQRVADLIRSEGLEPVAILLTHSHFDHILGIPGLRSVWPELPIYCHAADVNDSRKTEVLFGTTFPSIAAFAPITRYGEGDRVAVGGLSVEVIHTPGHTPGSVTLKVENTLFTGDTLFRSSIGRTDLEGGSFGTLMQSLKKLAALDNGLQVCPGHEGMSSLGDEKRWNGYLAQAMQM